MLREISKPFKIAGQWAAPGLGDRDVPGELSYAPERCELSLMGSFQQFPQSIIQPFARAPVIHGVSTTGERFSLLNPVRGQVSTSFTTHHAGISETWVCPLVLSGVHAGENPELPMLEFRIPGLQFWLGQQVIVSRADQQDEGFSRTFRVRSTPHELTFVPVIASELNWSTKVVTSGGSFHLTAESSGWCQVRPAAPRPLRWYFTQLEAITALLTFTAGTSMSADCMSFPSGEQGQSGSVLVPRRDAAYCGYQKQHEFFLTRPVLSELFGDIVRKWFEGFPALSSTIQLAVSIVASPNLWQHVEFLSWMQALEGFHRGTLPGLYMPSDEYESVKQSLGTAIPSSLTKAHRDSLRSRIRYGNELSLARRLNELADQLGQELRVRLFGSSGNVPRAWIDTRNYYTHWDEQSRSGLMNTQQLLHANLRLRLFVQSLYLNFAGVDQRAILTALGGSNEKSQWLLQINGGG